MEATEEATEEVEEDIEEEGEATGPAAKVMNTLHTMGRRRADTDMTMKKMNTLHTMGRKRKGEDMGYPTPVTNPYDCMVGTKRRTT